MIIKNFYEFFFLCRLYTYVNLFIYFFLYCNATHSHTRVDKTYRNSVPSTSRLCWSTHQRKSNRSVSDPIGFTKRNSFPLLRGRFFFFLLHFPRSHVPLIYIYIFFSLTLFFFFMLIFFFYSLSSRWGNSRGTKRFCHRKMPHLDIVYFPILLFLS